MSTITKDQAKDLRNAFECWQQDYDPIEDKEQYDMFGLGMVAMDALLASLEAEAVAWRYRFVHTPKSEEHGSPFTTDWVIAHSEDECNPSDCFERQPLFTAPPAPLKTKE